MAYTFVLEVVVGRRSYGVVVVEGSFCEVPTDRYYYYFNACFDQSLLVGHLLWLSYTLMGVYCYPHHLV